MARSDVRPPGVQTVVISILRYEKLFFCKDWSWKYFCSHILPTADSRRLLTNGFALSASWTASSEFGFGWLCWGLTSQSTIFQSCRDGAIASWVINQYFRGVKCLAQGHNTAAVGLEPRTPRSGVRHSTTEPPRSPKRIWYLSPMRAVSQEEPSDRKPDP